MDKIFQVGVYFYQIIYYNCQMYHINDIYNIY